MCANMCAFAHTLKQITSTHNKLCLEHGSTPPGVQTLALGGLEESSSAPAVGLFPRSGEVTPLVDVGFGGGTGFTALAFSLTNPRVGVPSAGTSVVEGPALGTPSVGACVGASTVSGFGVRKTHKKHEHLTFSDASAEVRAPAGFFVGLLGVFGMVFFFAPCLLGCTSVFVTVDTLLHAHKNFTTKDSNFLHSIVILCEKRHKTQR